MAIGTDMLPSLLRVPVEVHPTAAWPPLAHLLVPLPYTGTQDFSLSCLSSAHAHPQDVPSVQALT